ncbi:MAG: hypothetical protein IJ514_00515 [Clostridia bacterium]|nr:hypothetical protein [Clostridia bacterium]
MEKLVLIGDSIRMGYDKYVKEALRGVAEVYYPEENCRFAEYVLRYAHEWKNQGSWPSDADLVHFYTNEGTEAMAARYCPSFARSWIFPPRK